MKKGLKKGLIGVGIAVVLLYACGSMGDSETESTPKDQTVSSAEAVTESETMAEMENVDKGEFEDIGDTDEGMDAGVDTDAMLEMYKTIGKQLVMEYTPSASALDFISSHYWLFPTEVQNVVSDTSVNYSVEPKHIMKNPENYNDTIVYLKDYKITEINEDDVSGRTITEIMAFHVDDYNVSYVLVIYDGVADVYQGDSIYIYGLPMDVTSSENVIGGTTDVVVIAGSAIGKAGEEDAVIEQAKYESEAARNPYEVYTITGNWEMSTYDGPVGMKIKCIDDQYIIGFIPLLGENLVGYLDTETDGMDGKWLYYPQEKYNSGDYTPVARLTFYPGDDGIVELGDERQTIKVESLDAEYLSADFNGTYVRGY